MTTEDPDQGESTPDDLFEDIPYIPLGLIEALKRRFPLRTPRLDESDRQIWAFVGYQEMISWLAFVQEHQSKQQVKESG